MKRVIFFICFSILALISCLHTFAQDSDRVKHSYEDWEYVTNTSGLTLVGYLGHDSEPEIPSEIHGISVTMLGEEIFKNSSFLRSVIIPDSVTSIGRTAFQGCSSLTEIHLPDRLTRIESYTFRYCTSLERIDLPDTLTVIGSYSFSGCIKLAEIVMPNTVTSVGQSAFDDCTALESITFSKNLNHLDGNAFRNTPWLDQQNEEGPVIVGNTVLLKWNGMDSIVDIPYGVTMITDAFADNIYVESVTIPSTVTRIGQNAFRNAVNLRNVEIPDTVTRIDGYAFQGDRSLRSIILPNTITTIGSSVFRGCEKLTQIELPHRVTSIGTYLLAECTSLSDVTIPSSVKSIHDTAFSGSEQVRLHVTFDSEAERFAQEHLIPFTYYLQQTKDFIYSRNEDGIQILKYIGNLFDVEVPAEIDGLPVNRINTAAFQNNSIARRVLLPDTVVTIGDWAFSYMDSLEAVRMSSGLISLGADAFTGSAGIQVINLPDTLEYIGVEPFEGIENLAICTVSNSSTEELLKELGYIITDSDICNENSFLNDFNLVPTEKVNPVITRTPTPDISSTPTPTMTLTFTPTVTLTPTITMTPTPELISILYIPEGKTEVTQDMLINTDKDLTLVLPDSVTYISDDIVSGHTLTIVAESGTAGETFARNWNTKFLIKTWYEMDHSGAGG